MVTNVNAPFGFRAVQQLGRQTYQEKFILYSDLAVSLYDGDPVKSDGAGGITLAERGDTILGVFRGWHIPTNQIGAASYAGGLSMTNLFSRVWTPGTVIPNSMNGVAMVECDPMQVWEVMCCGTIALADIGTFVNLEPRSGDSTNGRSRVMVGPPINGGPLSSVTVGGSGSGYVNGNAITVTRHASDPYAGAAEAAGTIAVTTGNVTGVTLTAGGFYSASHLPTVTAPTGTGNTFTAVIASPVTRDQFQIMSVVEKAVRQVDANNNTTGHGLGGLGQYALVRVKCVNHERMGSAYGVAV